MKFVNFSIENIHTMRVSLQKVVEGSYFAYF